MLQDKLQEDPQGKRFEVGTIDSCYGVCSKHRNDQKIRLSGKIIWMLVDWHWCLGLQWTLLVIEAQFCEHLSIKSNETMHANKTKP